MHILLDQIIITEKVKDKVTDYLKNSRRAHGPILDIYTFEKFDENNGTYATSDLFSRRVDEVLTATADYRNVGNADCVSRICDIPTYIEDSFDRCMDLVIIVTKNQDILITSIEKGGEDNDPADGFWMGLYYSGDPRTLANILDTVGIDVMQVLRQGLAGKFSKTAKLPLHRVNALVKTALETFSSFGYDTRTGLTNPNLHTIVLKQQKESDADDDDYGHTMCIDLEVIPDNLKKPLVITTRHTNMLAEPLDDSGISVVCDAKALSGQHSLYSLLQAVMHSSMTTDGFSPYVEAYLDDINGHKVPPLAADCDDYIIGDECYVSVRPIVFAPGWVTTCIVNDDIKFGFFSARPLTLRKLNRRVCKGLMNLDGLSGMELDKLMDKVNG